MGEVVAFNIYRPCRCGARPPKVSVSCGPRVGAWVECFDCEETGPVAASEDEAVRLWNVSHRD